MTGVFLISAVITMIMFPGVSGRSTPTKPIPNGLRYRFIPEREKSLRYQSLDYSAPITHATIPQHPFMANNAGSNMHNDAYMSDTYQASGPIGLNLQISSRTQGFGGYGTLAFDSARRLVGVFGNARSYQLELMDPYSLEELASYDLPPRPWYFPLQGVMPWEYIGAGIYFYLDDKDRAVVPTTMNTIQLIKVPGPEQGAEFELVREYDLGDHVVPMPWPKQDSVAWVLPEWEGKHYWYATTEGIVGAVEADSGKVRKIQLTGEVIENSFAVGEDGIYILSDHALYRFSRNGDGKVKTDWRTEYDRGGSSKPGHITRGSGTSVTLLGDMSGLVAITDNAEPRINLLLARRSDGEVVCKVPLFEEGKSGTDITTIGFEQGDDSGTGTGVYSLLVENNWGHSHFPFARPAPGITRVDAKRAPDGSYHCEIIWTSEEKNIGVFKLSLGNGLLYLYFRGNSLLNPRWYFTAVDFATGGTVYKQLTGTGLGYNNWAGAIFLHPDGGTAYSTTLFGLVEIRDTSP